MKIELETKYDIGQCFKLLPEYGEEIFKIVAIVYDPDEEDRYYYLMVDAYHQAENDFSIGDGSYTTIPTPEIELDREYTLSTPNEYKYQYEEQLIKLKTTEEPYNGY